MHTALFMAAASVLLAISATANATSFDCSKTKAPADQTICTNPVLSQKDDALAALFAKAKAAAIDKKAFREEQRLAWNWRQKNCVDPACLNSWYTERTTALSHVVATGSVAGFEAPLVSGVPKATARTRATSTAPAAVPQKKVHYVHPTDILEAYSGNSIAADRQYQDKEFAMSGRVARVGIDDDRKPYIGLYSNYPGRLVKALMLEDGQPEILAELKPFDIVQMDCVGAGTNDGQTIAYVYCRNIKKVATPKNGGYGMPTIVDYKMLGAMP